MVVKKRFIPRIGDARILGAMFPFIIYGKAVPVIHSYQLTHKDAGVQAWFFKNIGEVNPSNQRPNLNTGKEVKSLELSRVSDDQWMVSKIKSMEASLVCFSRGKLEWGEWPRPAAARPELHDFHDAYCLTRPRSPQPFLPTQTSLRT